MKNFFYDLSGGINLAQSKIALGMNTKKMYWADSENIEIYQNRAIVRMRGNALLGSVSEQYEAARDVDGSGHLSGAKRVSGCVVCEYGLQGDFVMLFGTCFFYYSALSGNFELKRDDLSNFESCSIVPYLNGVVVTNGADAPFYFEQGRMISKDGAQVLEEIVEFGDKGANGLEIRGSIAAVFAGRLWIAQGSTVYYSALGTYDDWTTPEDAGYISDFHVSTSEITCLKVYRDNLAIYKQDGVYLLTGSGAGDFAVVPFADKGASGAHGVLTLNNRQYFFNRCGVFALEQVGELAQLALSDNIAANIAPVFENFDILKLDGVRLVPYEAKNQIWFLIPGASNGEIADSSGETVIWVYDYVNKAWFKRVVPHNIIEIAQVKGKIYSVNSDGDVFIEDLTSTFNGETVRFKFSSPFLTLGEPNSRKTVDEFYFIFDESRDNRFNFAVSKDYLSSEKDDLERISDYQPRTMIWDTFSGDGANSTCWAPFEDIEDFNDGASSGGAMTLNEENQTETDSTACLWAEIAESAYKTEINDSNLSVQLHFEGREPQDDLAIIGLEFKEVYYD